MDMQNPAEVRAFSEQTRSYSFIPSAVQAAQHEAASWAFLFCLMDEVLKNLAV
jgi:hypothetical protein